MSHFTVLVIGAEPEKQLQPFHEFECTGTNDQYVQEIDRTEEARTEYAEREDKSEGLAAFIEGWYGHEVVPFGEKPDLEGRHQFGYVLVNEAGEVEKVVRRTNPNKQWDWYVLGGRWSGMFRLKPGATSGVVGSPGLFTAEAPAGYADAALKGEIDFEAMRIEAEGKAAEDYDAIRSIIEPHLATPVVPWPELRAKYLGDSPELPGGIQAARDTYHAQPAVAALSKAHPFKDIEVYLGDRATFIRHAGIQSGMTFAVVKDGQWYERGSMGWFGFVADEKDRGAWIEEFGKLVDSLPDDTLLSVYDCHI